MKDGTGANLLSKRMRYNRSVSLLETRHPERNLVGDELLKVAVGRQAAYNGQRGRTHEVDWPWKGARKLQGTHLEQVAA